MIQPQSIEVILRACSLLIFLYNINKKYFEYKTFILCIGHRYSSVYAKSILKVNMVTPKIIILFCLEVSYTGLMEIHFCKTECEN